MVPYRLSTIKLASDLLIGTQIKEGRLPIGYQLASNRLIGAQVNVGRFPIGYILIYDPALFFSLIYNLGYAA